MKRLLPALCLLLAACATKLSQPMPTFVSWSGSDQATSPLVDEVRRRIGASPAFKLGFSSAAMGVNIKDAASSANGRTLTFQVGYALPKTIGDVRIEKNQLGAEIVSCPADDLDPCADRIVSGALAAAQRGERAIRTAKR